MGEIIYVIALCIGIDWSPATGPVHDYEAYVSAELQNTVTVPPASICPDDDGEVHAVIVYARDIDGNYSPPSPHLLVERVPFCDYTNTGSVSMFDIFAMIPLLGVEPDLLNVFDLFECIDRLGTCIHENGTIEVAC